MSGKIPVSTPGTDPPPGRTLRVDDEVDAPLALLATARAAVQQVLVEDDHVAGLGGQDIGVGRRPGGRARRARCASTVDDPEAPDSAMRGSR